MLTEAPLTNGPDPCPDHPRRARCPVCRRICRPVPGSDRPDPRTPHDTYPAHTRAYPKKGPLHLAPCKASGWLVEDDEYVTGKAER